MARKKTKKRTANTAQKTPPIKVVKRRLEIEEFILAGYPRLHLAAICREKWNISPRMLDVDIQKIKDGWYEEFEPDRKKRRTEHLRSLKRLALKLEKNGKYKDARDTIALIARLDGTERAALDADDPDNLQGTQLEPAAAAGGDESRAGQSEREDGGDGLGGDDALVRESSRALGELGTVAGRLRLVSRKSS